jgi:uncharacterized GH25 family protein
MILFTGCPNGNIVPCRYDVIWVLMNIYNRIGNMRKFAMAVVPLFFGLLTYSAQAHEYWLEPNNYAPPTGATVTISHNYGSDFKGDGLPYVAEWHQRYIVADEKGERRVSGLDGDLPAIQTKFKSPGLKVFGYFGTPEPQDYDTMEAFAVYLRKVGLDHIVSRHQELGKPKTKILEIYARNAKMLLGVGAAQGRDRALGLPLELIAGRNPYDLKPGDTLPVRLLYRGKPIAGVAIFTFNRVDPKNPVRTVTDTEGRVTIALPATGAYLLNAVHMFQPAAGEESDWTSLWASLTFALR